MQLQTGLEKPILPHHLLGNIFASLELQLEVPAYGLESDVTMDDYCPAEGDPNVSNVLLAHTLVVWKTALSKIGQQSLRQAML